MASVFQKSLNLLKNANDFSTAEVGRTLDSVLGYNTGIELHKEAKKHGYSLGQLIDRVLQSLAHYFTTPDNSQGTRNLSKTTNFLWNYSDGRPDFCCELGSSGVISRIVAILKQMATRPQGEWHVRQLKALMGCLHNAIQGDECIAANRSVYRKAGAFEVLQNWIRSSDMALKVDSLLILSYITNDNESEILEKNDQVVAFLVNLLKNAVESSQHTASIGSVRLSAQELLDGLNQLIIHDANKKVVVKNGGEVIIARMLKSDFSKKERMLAIRALWSLSFDESVRKSNGIQKSIAGEYSMELFHIR